MHRSLRYLSKYLSNLREDEEDFLPGNAFVGVVAKGYKYGLLVICIVGIGMDYFLSVPIQDLTAGIAFGAIGIISLLMLPSYFSYRCYVDKSTLKTEYFILCFKVKKEVLWKDVKYKAIKRDSNGDALSIRLYNIDKKKLINFDVSIAGFQRIVQMSKGIPKLKR